MEDMELWTAYTSQILALAALLGALLGTLRKTEILTEEALDAAFLSAEKHLPDTARPAGANLLTHLRMMAEVTGRAHDPDHPRG